MFGRPQVCVWLDAQSVDRPPCAGGDAALGGSKISTLQWENIVKRGIGGDAMPRHLVDLTPALPPPAGRRRDHGPWPFLGAGALRVYSVPIMRLLALSDISFCSGRRIGEAAHPGPYYEGGATGSGTYDGGSLISSSGQGVGGHAAPSHPGASLTTTQEHIVGRWENIGHQKWVRKDKAETRATTATGDHPLRQYKGQTWQWTDHEQALAAGRVPAELRWPLPIVCRDATNRQRQTRLVHPDDILDCVRHELQGHAWTSDDLEEELERLYAKGGGTFDPASICRGPTDFALLESQYGVADSIHKTVRPYSDFFPPGSKKVNRTSPDLIDGFLRSVEKNEKAAPPAEAMRAASRTHGITIDMPTIEEDVQGTPADTDSSPFVPEYVGAATQPRSPQERKKRRRRREKMFPATRAISATATSGRTRGMRASRGKGAHRATVDLILINSSGKPQLIAALEESQGASVIINQEHQCHAAAWVDLQHDAKNLGWTLVGASATKTVKDGVSARVAIASTKHVRLGSIGGAFDHSLKSYPGRIAAAWVNVGPDTGIVIISVYLFHTELLTARNRGILNQAIAIARNYGSPWLIAGDLNMPPNVLMAHWGEILENIDGYIIATKEPTHRPKCGAHRILDYVICSASVEPWVESIRIDEGFHAAPHRALRIKLRAAPKNYFVHGIKAPKAFASRPAVGCPRRPVLPEWHRVERPEQARPSSALGGHAGVHDISTDTVDEMWPALCHAMESELCRAQDCVDQHGNPLKTHTGRAVGLRVVQRLALPMRASASLGKVSIQAHALTWFNSRVRELAGISRKIQRGHAITTGTVRQWSDIMGKITARSGLAQVIRRISLDWNDQIETIKNHVLGRDTFTLERACELSQSAAEKIKTEHLKGRADAWKTFVGKQLKSGAATAHRLVKRDGVQCVDTTTTGVGESRTASPQAVLDHDLIAWRKIWTRMGDAPSAPWRGAPLSGPRLPPITAADLESASRTFSPDTGIGCDGFPPRAIAGLSTPLRGCIAQFLNYVEETGYWPTAVATALIHLILKSDGGRRPIGVLPTIVRVWERARKPIVQKWIRDNARKYDWATQGRSSEGAVWHQALLDEAATADRLSSASTLTDLEKAFEMVSLSLVWEAGLRHAFPLAILRLMLESFAFARRLTYQRAVSEPTCTLSAALAGGGFAQVALLLVLLDPLDQIQAAYPLYLTVCLYVDDIALHVVGDHVIVATVLAAATDMLVQILEDDLHMKVSRRERWAIAGKAKSTVAVSCPKVKGRISTTMRRLGILITQKAKHLGIEYGPGARTRAPKGARSRWTANAARRARVTRLGRRLGRHVFATGLKPALMYGSTVAALNQGTFNAMRRAAGRTLGNMRGRSLTARLTVNQCDPGWDAIKGPIQTWTSEVWMSRVPTRTMERAWMHAQSCVSTSSRPQSSSGGAAGTYIAALKRVGWSSPAYNAVRTLDGTILQLDQQPPKTVLRFLQDDFQITFAAATAVFTPQDGSPGNLAGGYAGRKAVESDVRYCMVGGQPIPWFQPAASVINSKWAKGIPPAAIASAATLPEGGWWTQAKLAACGLASHPFCTLCHNVVGTLSHRMFRCPRRREQIANQCPKSLVEHARAEPDNPLFRIGVPARPKCPDPPPPGENWVGVRPVDGAAAAGVAYTGGALRGTVPKARRAGWAYVVDDNFSPMWGKFGVCSEPYTTVLRAELHALVEILRVTTGPIVIYVDNLEVVNGISNGQRWCCHPKRDGADLWRSIWARLRELEGLVRVEKVKAHLTYQHVLDGKISWSNWIGNGIADMWAKQGCAEASRLSPSDWVEAEWHKACAVYKWAACIAAEWVADTEVASPPPQPPISSRTGGVRTKRKDRTTHSPHELWRSKRHGWCRLCGINGPWNRRARPTIFSRPCAGTMGTRCAIVGRELAISPGKSAYDDGTIAMESLFAYGAEKVVDTTGAPDPDGPLGGHAGRQNNNLPSLAHTLPVQLPHFEDEEEDPFGHGSLGFDQPHAGVLQVAPVPRVSMPAVSCVQRPSGAHQSHSLRRTGNIVWCVTCGRHAAIRLGVGLIRPCRGEATGGYPTRIARLKIGRHPVSGDRI